MQRYARDLWSELKKDEGIKAGLCIPRLRGEAAFIEVMLKAILRSFIQKHSVIICASADLSFLGWLLVRLRRGRIILTAHGLDLLLKRKWYKAMIQKCLPKLDAVICVSSATAEVVKSKGIPEEKIVVIPNGINPESFGIRYDSSDNAPVLLTVGRLIKRKGHEWFIRNVLPKVSSVHPGILYRIIGRGSEELSIRKAISDLILEKNVELVTDADDDECEQAYLSSDLFIMPNIPVDDDMEGFGIVCIEASGRGLPVVASHLEGIRDAVVDGVTGRFYSSGDASECASVILGMLENPMDSKRVREETLSKFSWGQIYDRYRKNAFKL